MTTPQQLAVLRDVLELLAEEAARSQGERAALLITATNYLERHAASAKVPKEDKHAK